MATWKSLIVDTMEQHGDSFDNIVDFTPADLDWDREFDDGFGGENGKPFTAWTENRVYFPVCYDGAEWVGSAPRNPCDEETEHQGGG